MLITNKPNIWSWIWDISEVTGIGLGRLGPYVFAKMMGCKEYRRVK